MDDAFELAACGLLVTATKGAIERANRCFCAWTGFSEAELLGRRFQDLLTMGSKLFYHTQWMPLLQMQGSVAEVQLELVHRDGRAVPVLVNAAQRGVTPGAEPGERPRVDIAVLVATDRRKYERELLHARKRAEELLASEREAQEARARAEAALRRQEEDARLRAVFAEQLIGIVSHDLRNPLNAVLLGTHLLRAPELEAHSRTVNRIASAAQRANRLITDLLDFTQARLGGGLRVDARELDLHKVGADCLDELRLAWPGRRVDHRRRGEAKGAADPDRLVQLMTNLLNNALTYGSRDGAVTLTTIAEVDALGIEVHNDGAPIPRELQQHIFEPMRRGASDVTPRTRSVGLGLYIVREIATAHGGDVTVRSNEHEGTTFTVHLPQPPPQRGAA